MWIDVCSMLCVVCGFVYVVQCMWCGVYVTMCVMGCVWCVECCMMYVV